MNYFDIINRVLVEMNYKEAQKFEDLNKLEEKKLMYVINRVNKDICYSCDDFYFRKFKKEFEVKKGEFEFGINYAQKILKVMLNDQELKFEGNWGKFYGNCDCKGLYGFFGKKLLLKGEGLVRVFFITTSCVKGVGGNLKDDFEFGDDESIIPSNFAEELLVYGSAYKFKQNTLHPKYGHWRDAYLKALSDLNVHMRLSKEARPKFEAGFKGL